MKPLHKLQQPALLIVKYITQEQGRCIILIDIVKGFNEEDNYCLG